MMKSKPAEAADYESPFRNTGDHFDANNNRLGTVRVWGVYNISKKNNIETLGDPYYTVVPLFQCSRIP